MLLNFTWDSVLRKMPKIVLGHFLSSEWGRSNGVGGGNVVYQEQVLNILKTPAVLQIIPSKMLIIVLD